MEGEGGALGDISGGVLMESSGNSLICTRAVRQGYEMQAYGRD